MSSKLVLFDCDGTLADSHVFLTRVVEESLRHVGAGLPSPELMREFYSLPFDEFFRRLDGHMSAEQIVAASTYMRTKLRDERSSGAMTEPLYPGIADILRQLEQQGFLLGVVTNKGGFGLEMVLKSNGVRDLFITLNHTDNAPPKPAPDMVLNGLREAGVDAPQCLVVGDSLIDMLTARNAGVAALGVTWAGRDAGQLQQAGARQVIAQVNELIPAITAWAAP